MNTDPRSIRWCATLVVAMTALGGCAMDGSTDGTTTDSLAAGQTLFSGSGSLSPTGTSWWQQSFDVPRAGAITVTLNWPNAAADMNVFLYDAQGTRLAGTSGSTARPERLAYTVPAAGSYSVGVVCHGAASTFTVTVSQSFAPSFPGEPAPGSLIWGASLGGGDLVVRHETPTGHPLALVRRFYQWNQRATAMPSDARDDQTHHRLSWVSTKTPPWAEMAAGQHDAEIDDMLRALDALPGPVWLTMHHEPENDTGNPADHVGMNRRVRQRMTALHTDNIALAPILMGFSFSNSARHPDDWWAPGIYDFFGVDDYQPAGGTLINDRWHTIRTWAAAKGVEIAVGEWGMRGTDAAAGQLVRDWFDEGANSYDDGGGARVIGMSAFDSNANSTGGGWVLQGAQLQAFHAMMVDPRDAMVEP